MSWPNSCAVFHGPLGAKNVSSFLWYCTRYECHVCHCCCWAIASVVVCWSVYQPPCCFSNAVQVRRSSCFTQLSTIRRWRCGCASLPSRWRCLSVSSSLWESACFRLLVWALWLPLLEWLLSLCSSSGGRRATVRSSLDHVRFRVYRKKPTKRTRLLMRAHSVVHGR